MFSTSTVPLHLLHLTIINMLEHRKSATFSSRKSWNLISVPVRTCCGLDIPVSAIFIETSSSHLSDSDDPSSLSLPLLSPCSSWSCEVSAVETGSNGRSMYNFLSFLSRSLPASCWLWLKWALAAGGEVTWAGPGAFTTSAAGLAGSGALSNALRFVLSQFNCWNRVVGATKLWLANPSSTLLQVWTARVSKGRESGI